MHIPTGQIHHIPEGETLEDYAERLDYNHEDFVMLEQPPSPTCKRCNGRGSVKKGLFSRRFKPCKCTRKKVIPAILALKDQP